MGSTNEHLDWTQDLGATNINAGNYTDTNTTYTAGAPVQLNGTIFTMDVASTSGDGYLSSGDWDTFTAKYGALTDMTLTDNYIYVGDASNNPVGVAMSNDCTIASNGAITCDHDALDNFVAAEHIDWTGASDNFLTSGTLEVGSTASIGGAITFSDLTDCDTIDTDANGLLSCGTDDSGGDGMSQTNLLSYWHDDTLAASVSEGSLILGNATPAWSELGIGASSSYLISNGTTAVWNDLIVDISDDTNLTGGTGITMNGDAIDLDNDFGAAIDVGEITLAQGVLIRGNTVGEALALGASNSVLWSDGTDPVWNDLIVDGELIKDDTIDNDSIDWGDMIDLDTDGAVSWGNITAGELANDSIIDADIDDDGNFTFTGTWDFSGGDIVLPTTSVDAGTYAAGSIVEVDLNVDEEPVDNDILTFDTTGDNFSWQTRTELGLLYGGGTLTDTYLCVADGTSGAIDCNIAQTFYVEDGCTDCLNATEIEDIYLLDDGDVGTGAYDFGGVTSFEIPNAAGLTLDANGEIAIDTTADQLKYYSGGEIHSMVATESFSFVVSSGSFDATEVVGLKKFLEPVTITAVNCVVTSGTSVVIDIQECDGNGANCATIDSTITCGNTNTADDGTLTNPSIDAGDWVNVDLGAVTGVVNWLSVTVYYKWVGE